MGSLRDQKVACSTSDCQGSNFESCVWSAGHLIYLTILKRFSRLSLVYMHKGGLKLHSLIMAAVDYWIVFCSAVTKIMSSTIFIFCFTSVNHAVAFCIQHVYNYQKLFVVAFSTIYYTSIIDSHVPRCITPLMYCCTYVIYLFSCFVYVNHWFNVLHYLCHSSTIVRFSFTHLNCMSCFAYVNLIFFSAISCC